MEIKNVSTQQTELTVHDKIKINFQIMGQALVYISDSSKNPILDSSKNPLYGIAKI